MKTYTTPGGVEIRIGDTTFWVEDMYADLVAALGIARAYQAKCERLEAQVAQLCALLAVPT